MTSQPGHDIVRQLEVGLKDADVMSLKRLLVVQVCSAVDWGQENPSSEATQTETEGRMWTQKYTLYHTVSTRTVYAVLLKINKYTHTASVQHNRLCLRKQAKETYTNNETA